jgi:catalase
MKRKRWPRATQTTTHKISGASFPWCLTEVSPTKNRDRIAAGNFPTWTVAIQTMTPEESLKFEYDVNDLTKVWPEVAVTQINFVNNTEQ